MLCESLAQRETVLTDVQDEMLDLGEAGADATGHSVAALEALGAHSRRINDIQRAIEAAAAKGGLDGQAAVESLAVERAEAAAATSEGLDAVLRSLELVDRQYGHALGVLTRQEARLDELEAATRRDASIGDGVYQLGPEPPRPVTPPPSQPAAGAGSGAGAGAGGSNDGGGDGSSSDSSSSSSESDDEETRKASAKKKRQERMSNILRRASS